MLASFVKLKMSARAVVLACAFAVFSCAASFAQDAPKPQQPAVGQAPAAPAQAEGVMDPDKKVVQDRWGYSTGEPAKKVEKKRRPEKPKPASDKQ